MAGLESDRQTQINPGLLSAQNLIAPYEPIVTPNSVAALADAFRKGQISADDIISRYGDLAKTKERVEIQGLEEMISPEAIQTRKDILTSSDAKAKLEGAKARTDLPLIEPEAQARRALADATRLKAELSKDSYGEQADYARKLGFDVPDVPSSGPDTAWKTKVAGIYKKAVGFDTTRQRAEKFLAAIKSQPEETITIKPGPDGRPVEQKKIGPKVVHVGPDGSVIDEKTYNRIQALAHATPEDYEKGPITVSDVFAGVKPGEVAPKAAEARPEVAPVAAVSEEGTVISTKPSTVAEKTPTDAQQRAQLALSRFAQSNNMFQALQEQGYDPTSIGSWMNSLLPEILKSGNRKAYDSAVDAWSQGLLRLESGAAISNQEKSWYDKAFFPQVNDPPAVVESKRTMRNDIERMVSEIAQSGGVVSPESASQAKKIYEEAQKFGGPVTAAGAASPAGQIGKPVEIGSGKKLVKTPQGWRYAR